MPILKICYEKEKFSPPLPHIFWINGQKIGIMQKNDVTIELPEGDYMVKIQSVFPFFFATKFIKIKEKVQNNLSFKNREKWWDILFTIDLIFWFAELFFKLPAPWNLIYKIATNGYFVVWLIYEWIIREKYYRMDFYTSKL